MSTRRAPPPGALAASVSPGVALRRGGYVRIIVELTLCMLAVTFANGVCVTMNVAPAKLLHQPVAPATGRRGYAAAGSATLSFAESNPIRTAPQCRPPISTGIDRSLITSPVSRR
jgi:hypothetical protein